MSKSTIEAKEKGTSDAPWEKIPKPPKQPTVKPFPIKQTVFPQKSRYKKGKGKVDDISQNVPAVVRPISVLRVVDRSVEAPSVEPKATRTEPEVVEISPRENTKVGQTGVVPKANTDAMSAALKRGFLNALISSKKFLGKKLTIHEALIDARPSREITIPIEECGSLEIVPPPDVPSP